MNLQLRCLFGLLDYEYAVRSESAEFIFNNLEFIEYANFDELMENIND